MAEFTEIQSYGWVFNLAVASVLLISIIWFWHNLSDKIKKPVFIFIGLLSLLILYFMSEKLETRIDDAGIHYKMFPIQFSERNISWEQVSNIYVKDYIIYGNKVITYDVYSIADKYGLYIILNDGTKIILGTKKPAEINKILVEHGR